MTQNKKTKKRQISNQHNVKAYITPYFGIIWKSILFCFVAIAIIQIQQYYFNFDLGNQNETSFSRPQETKETTPKHITPLWHCQASHGSVTVYEDTQKRIRFLRSDNSIIGGEWIDYHTPLFTAFIIQSAARYVSSLSCQQNNGLPCQALQLGLGVGSAAKRLRENRINVDVVEIDPCVVEATQKWFSFETSSENRIFTQDAFDFLSKPNSPSTQPRNSILSSESDRQHDQRYDIIIHDLFSASISSPQLMTRETFIKIRDHWLQPSGVFVLNVVGHHHGRYARGVHHVFRTLSQVFSSVRVFVDAPLSISHHHNVENLIFFCNDQPNLSFLKPLETKDSHIEFSPDWIESHFEEWEVTQKVQQYARDAAPLTFGAENPLPPLQREISALLWQEISATLLYM
eukprot:gb/GECH01007903.1/.p1 GENE.gb/GECH01007903.1/~~gb/GECH01007903.1/.p1  ORF type:complete len:402 (+),score=81.18 gb/GECH01007903.1/:1-1206(+)